MRSNIVRTPSGASVPDSMPASWSPFSAIRSLGLGALGGFEEDGEVAQVLGAELRERGHRRSRRLARRIRQVVYLPLEAAVAQSLLTEVRRAEVVSPVAEVRVAVQAPGLREQLGARQG